MSPEPGTFEQRVERRLERIEDSLTRRLDALDGEVDDVQSRLDKLDGAVGMVKWLGPSGLGALLFGVLKSIGVI